MTHTLAIISSIFYSFYSLYMITFYIRNKRFFSSLVLWCAIGACILQIIVNVFCPICIIIHICNISCAIYAIILISRLIYYIKRNES